MSFLVCDYAGGDNRGKHIPWNKTPESTVALVHEHLNMIPKMASHYCRKDSRKQYVDPQLSVPRLCELYLTWLKDKSTATPADELLKNPVSERRYREIFVNDFNISHSTRRKISVYFVKAGTVLVRKKRKTEHSRKWSMIVTKKMLETSKQQ